MTFDGFRRQYESALDFHSEGEYEEAATHYAAAGHEMIGASRELTEEAAFIDRLNPDKLGRGLEQWLRASICFRLGDHWQRAERLCKGGILIVQDVAENDPIFESSARQGLTREMIGDFRLVGGLERYDEEYEAAFELYSVYQEQEHQQIQWQSEPEFEYNISLFLELADAAGHSISEDTSHDIAVRSLLDRIEFKRQAAPEILENLLDTNSWEVRSGPS